MDFFSSTPGKRSKQFIEPTATEGIKEWLDRSKASSKELAPNGPDDLCYKVQWNVYFLCHLTVCYLTRMCDEDYPRIGEGHTPFG